MHRYRFSAMASPCEIILTGDEQHCLAASEAAAAEVHRIEAKYSRYRDNSELSRINRQAGSATEIDDETYQLLHYASVAWQQSDGVFDISAGILRQAWDFTRQQIPDSRQLAPLLSRIGWGQAQLNQQQILMPAGMEIDLGGLGKEYAADKAAQVCREHGFRTGVVDLGGDLHVLGPKNEEPWQIGVRHPRKPDHAFAQLPVYQGGMASSGDYERYFEYQGRRFCHLLNPHTGMPVDHWASISVLAPSCLLAGTLSTIAMLKQAQGLSWLQQQGVHFLAIRPDLSHHLHNG
ncbi:thiamine biosynthesis protein ApbE [Bacterioplanes sanyensis]|uniref:FAD:protein FMN transferase n=1 Tax=Bacterioplanes sanyensis TaxID=1249553 RepID=A0A222FLE4_9GAMM|nr:FAD:protein FMN transferase [Bacterioplanes sanyensis]ASP39416.1 thiamine biosynthesis protein ApbE [Bacterioplanes sanyensis]